MSLIHDALKKAQDKDKAPPGSGLASFQEAVDSGKPPIPKRTIVLGALFLIALAYFAYTKLAPEKKPPSPALSAGSPQAEAPQPALGEKDAGRLKRSAMDAYQLDDFDAAWASLSTASQLDPKDPEIWNNLGLVARKRGDVSKAREAYQKALELKPEYPEALNNLAVLDMQAGDNAKAKELLEKAIKISPAYPEANLHLALLYDQKGDRPKAIEYYKRFLDVGGRFPSSIVDSVRSRAMEIEP